jgi:hypothetical protein
VSVPVFVSLPISRMLRLLLSADGMCVSIIVPLDCSLVPARLPLLQCVEPGQRGHLPVRYQHHQPSRVLSRWAQRAQLPGCSGAALLPVPLDTCTGLVPPVACSTCLYTPAAAGLSRQKLHGWAGEGRRHMTC